MESSFVTGKPMLSKGASKQYTLSGIKSIKEHRLTFDSTGSERSDNLEQVIRNNNTEIGGKLQRIYESLKSETTAITLYDLLGYLADKYPHFYRSQQQDPSECLYHLLEHMNIITERDTK